MKRNLKIWTAQMNKTKGKGYPVLDITIKNKDKFGKIFAPTWKMVMDYKKGAITDEEYTSQYHTMMLTSYEIHRDLWEELLNKDEIVLMCFCRAGQFCHRHLLTNYLVTLGAEYMGELT